LKYITNETISRFKKFIHRLQKKEEESLLNKKKKREEIKQRNKIDKNKINNMNAPNPYNYYPNMYIPQMQINNQNPAYHNEYQNIYYLYPPYNPQMMPPFIPNTYLMPPRTLEESLSYIYNRGIVNNIIGAFFIKECQDKQKNNEKRKVPVSTVDLNNEGKDSDNKPENNGTNIDNKENGGENNLEQKEKESSEEKNEENGGQEKDNENEEPKNENELKMPNMG